MQDKRLSSVKGTLTSMTAKVFSLEEIVGRFVSCRYNGEAFGGIVVNAEQTIRGKVLTVHDAATGRERKVRVEFATVLSVSSVRSRWVKTQKLNNIRVGRGTV